MKVFIDTWGWLTLHNDREQRHETVSRFYLSLDPRRNTVYTSDFVLDETITLLYKRLQPSRAALAVRQIQEAVKAQYVRLERVTAVRFDEALTLRLKYADKPDISFTDFTSFVVMAELGIERVITGDDHFAKVGMGFLLVP